MVATFRKDPDATLDFAVDWSLWLEAGDTIASTTWNVAAGISQPASPAPSTTDGKATVWISGGTVGQTYPVTCRVVTSEGRIDERTISIQIEQR